MLRRRHKKSREGCLQCKQRHVKCDERRPACLLCAMSQRTCSYASEATPETSKTSDASSHERPNSPSTRHSRDDTIRRAVAPSRSAHLPTLHVRGGTNFKAAQPLERIIDLGHMELLIHLISDREMFNLADQPEVELYPSKLIYALNLGLEVPYLLHQMLAFSARHLAHLRPERSPAYLHQAFALQTRAVSLFNTAWTEVDRSNCVPILLFSTFLGHHLFADMLAKRDSGGLGAFLDHCVPCLDMYRGIYTIATTAWPLLMETELESVLSWSKEFTSREPQGTHCQRLLELLDTSSQLGYIDKEACRQAIQYIQVGLDAISVEEDKESSYRYQMVFSWGMLLTPEFQALLEARRAEALVVLAYYALLLHCSTRMWQVGDAGAYILQLISEFLGAEWDTWLEYPRKVISRVP